jgi:hypothetical protein
MSGYANTKIALCQGIPAIVVDGQPIHGMTATSCAFDDPAVVRDFVAAGVEIMMIWIEIGIHCWKGPGRYDWSYAEKKLTFFEEHSGLTKWIIRVRLGLLADWFRRAYPSEVHNPPVTPEEPEHISVSNIASSVWCKEVSGLVADFVKWLQGTRWAPRIIGFMLNAGATEEWLIFDTHETSRGAYHPVYVREMRAWLSRTYHNDADALRRAWNDPQVTFDTASPPTGMIRSGSHIWGGYTLRDPQWDRPAIDYYRFLNETLAMALIAVCRSAKEAARSPIICGGFHSYLWWETGVYSYIQEYGHSLIQILNDSPWVDFVSDITSYDNRYPGGPSGYLGLPQSLNLHHKLHYTEVDLKTIVCLTPRQREAWQAVDSATIPAMTAEPAIPDRIWRWDDGYCGRDEAEEVARIQREHIHNLITGTAYWWFDIASHHYQLPAIVSALRKLSDIGKESMKWDRRSIAEIAFVCSEETPFFQSAMNGSLLRFEMESAHGLLLDLATRKWGLAGVPFDIYELHDLNHPDFPGSQYKLLIFVNCARISSAAAAGIKRWQRDDRVFCWTFAAGVVDEQTLAPSLNQDLIGMKLAWKRTRRNIHVEISETDHPLTKGGAALNFGTEGSVGPVFFVDDPKARILGNLRDGGEPGFALRQHDGWRSVYLSMLNFGPDLLRNLIAFAGGHIWCRNNDVIYANHSLLCLHAATAGEKVVDLPGMARVTDLWTGEPVAGPTKHISLESLAYRTRVWRTEYVHR